MKQSNTHRVLYDAVSQIDPILIEEATASKKTLPAVKKIAAMAAVVALLLTMFFWPNREEGYITAPGLITVRAHEVDDAGNATIESVVLEEGVEFTSTVAYDPTKSYRQHFPFSFSIDEKLYPGMDITLEVSTNAGIFYKHDPFNPNSPMLPAILQIFNQFYGQHFTVDIDKKLYWEPEGFDYEYMAEQIENGNLDFNSAHKDHDYVDNPSFIDVIIRADEYVVGYCVIAIREINENDGHPDQEFSFEVLTIVNFPKVNGKMQKVKFSYVQDQIDLIHQESEKAS